MRKIVRAHPMTLSSRGDTSCSKAGMLLERKPSRSCSGLSALMDEAFCRDKGVILAADTERRFSDSWH